MNILSKLKRILGEKKVLDAPQSSERFTGFWAGNTPLDVKGIVMPSTSEEVAQVLSLCYEFGQSIIPTGGFTNLTFALKATPDDILLSLEKMNKIEEIDTRCKVAIVQSGVILQSLQEAAVDKGLLYPVDYGARGSAMIGGSISTNAGGIQVLRYGTTRSQVLGLEVVLPDGRILSSLNKMVKDNAGYNLKHLFIGSEGTLGVVTKASLRLQPKPSTRNTAFVAFDSFESVIDFKDFLDKKFMGTLTAFELIWQSYYQLMTTSPAPYKPPIGQEYSYYVLFEAQGNDISTDEERFQYILETAFAEKLIIDGAIAASESDHKWFWGIRENVEIIMAKGSIYIFDISLPIPEMEVYCEELKKNLNDKYEDVELYIFGHFGDGNLHIVIRVKEVFDENRHTVESIVYEPLTSINGSITAEHGIGMEKKEWLSICRSESEIEVMKQLKKVFDPKGILNPGKVF